MLSTPHKKGFTFFTGKGFCYACTLTKRPNQKKFSFISTSMGIMYDNQMFLSCNTKGALYHYIPLNAAADYSIWDAQREL